MNVLDQITVKQVPTTFFYSPQEIVMSDREIGILPGLISELVDMSITVVRPIERVGRVLTFDVTPYRKQDPPLIFCRFVDLREYYSIWASVLIRGYEYSREDTLSLYSKMMKNLNIAKLETDEAAFMIIEMLKFKNEYVRR